MAEALSAAALARLARPPPEPLSPPDIADHVAVGAWRTAVHADWLDGDPSADECGHRHVVVGGVRCLRRDRAAAPIVVYLHGGGYALGSPEVVLPITERLAAAGVEVVSVDYRLAPEHPYPAGLDDARAVYRSVRRAEPGRRVALAGDSAGGNLAVSLALAVAEDDPPVAVVLLSPHLDHAGPRRRGAPGPTDDLDAAAAAWLTAAYCGDRDPADPAVSPLRAELGELPRTLVQVGGREPLRPATEEFARRARDAGVDVTLDVWDGLWHTWHYHRDVPEAARALTAAADFVVSAVRTAG